VAVVGLSPFLFPEGASLFCLFQGGFLLVSSEGRPVKKYLSWLADQYFVRFYPGKTLCGALFSACLARARECCGAPLPLLHVWAIRRAVA